LQVQLRVFWNHISKSDWASELFFWEIFARWHLSATVFSYISFSFLLYCFIFSIHTVIIYVWLVWDIFLNYRTRHSSANTFLLKQNLFIFVDADKSFLGKYWSIESIHNKWKNSKLFANPMSTNIIKYIFVVREFNW
jgi:hypothetical protein